MSDTSDNASIRIKRWVSIVEAVYQGQAGSGNGINPAGMQRMAAAHAPGAEPDAAQHAMPCHGLAGITGTGRVEAAVIAQQRADKALVAADDSGNYFTHRKILRQCMLRD